MHIGFEEVVGIVFLFVIATTFFVRSIVILRYNEEKLDKLVAKEKKRAWVELPDEQWRKRIRSRAKMWLFTATLTLIIMITALVTHDY